MDALRNKFKALKNVKKPTGDPAWPPEVVRAKRNRRAIEKKVVLNNWMTTITTMLVLI